MTSQRNGGAKTDPNSSDTPRKEEDVRATQNPVRILQGGSDFPPGLHLSVQLLGASEPDDAEYEAWLDHAEAKIRTRLCLYQQDGHSGKVGDVHQPDLSSRRFKIG